MGVPSRLLPWPLDREVQLCGEAVAGLASDPDPVACEVAVMRDLLPGYVSDRQHSLLTRPRIVVAVDAEIVPRQVAPSKM